MRIASRIAAVALAATAALASASPASARINPSGLLECESGGYYHYTCSILDPGTHTNQYWKYNGSHVVSGDGHDSIYSACAANLNFSIGVTYVKNGVTKTTGMTLACLQYWQ